MVMTVVKTTTWAVLGGGGRPLAWAVLLAVAAGCGDAPPSADGAASTDPDAARAGTTAPPDADALRAELVALHEASIAAHLEGDADFFAADLADDYVVVSGAEIVRPTPEDVRAQFGSYLSSTEFARYETTDGPLVGLSDDGSVGWVIVAVDVEGTMADGADLAFRSAWLSLYRRVDGRWSMVANVSNVVPAG